MQSTYFPLSIQTPISCLKFRASLPSVGLRRNSPLVPVSPAYASVNGTTIAQSGGNIIVKATQSVDEIINIDEEQFDEEFLLRAGLEAERMPKHIAVIADGHRRWARQKGLPPKSGHRTLAPVYKDISRLCCKCGIKVFTAYLYSPENMKRSQEEVETIMSLFEEGIRSNMEESMRHGIRISVIGDRTILPKSLVEAITEAEEKTKANSRLHLILAINYGGQNEILQASRKLFKKIKDGLIQEEEINIKLFEQELGTNICSKFPFPDFMIRFGGELRLSNFLSYQLAYAELYFTNTLFPDFTEEDFIIAMKSYQKRNRRYGV
ncbi:Isoprenyl transferase [Heracleum sosnowskyi]|uniref:Alkyl transferase n=1 Tax=Heracleum sosnowskyi TaxID=360622 RepID=A0AAD8JJ52_9APIA|nr:Isoprenyl transferase [Heracleum sosnowskyi]